MNPSIDNYLKYLRSANEGALKSGETSIQASLPCCIFRELEVVDNDYLSGGNPLMSSYRSWSKVVNKVRPIIPRKIEMASAQYLKEAVIDFMFPGSPVSLFFVGDGKSDMRFSYKCFRQFEELGDQYFNYCYICDPNLDGKELAGRALSSGWNKVYGGKKLFYVSDSWKQLNSIVTLMKKEKRRGRRAIAVIDIDGTFLCPKPQYNSIITTAREDAFYALCKNSFSRHSFRPSSSLREVAKLACLDANKTLFSSNSDDSDLTMLIALAFAFELINPKDIMFTDGNGGVNFERADEFLTYMDSRIFNNKKWRIVHSDLRRLYQDALHRKSEGLPSIFPEFRKEEEVQLKKSSVLNASICEFIIEAANLGVPSIGYSDRPNKSMGLFSNNNLACTCSPRPDALFCKMLPLVGS